MSNVHGLHTRKYSREEAAQASASNNAVAQWWMLGVASAEFLLITAAAFGAAALYYRVVLATELSVQQYVIASLLLGGIFSLICLIDDQYNAQGENWNRKGISRAAGGVALAFVFLLSVNFLFKVADDYSRGTLLTQWVIVLPALIVLRGFFIHRTELAIAEGRLQGNRLVVLSLAAEDRHVDLAKKLGETGGKIIRWHHVPVGRVGNDTKDGLNRVFRDALAAIHAECRESRAEVVVIIFDANSLGYMEEAIDFIYELSSSIHLLPIGLLPFMRGSRIVESGRVRVLEVNPQRSIADRILKRGMDLVLASIALVVLAPLFLLVAAAIKLDSPGPVLFRQTRHGFNNEPIRVLKFRTMAFDQDTAFRQATKSDSRVTRLGSMLRRTNIDELPQLFNVLRGEMSLVGPRPHPVELNKAYAAQIRWMNRRHRVRPGITGWAQVNGLRGPTDTHDKMQLRVEHDLYYVDNQSFFFDIKILLLTVLSRKAYQNAY
jgi:Undecaprenyl-phosphate glucose phosphotransferase